MPGTACQQWLTGPPWRFRDGQADRGKWGPVAQPGPFQLGMQLFPMVLRIHVPGQNDLEIPGTGLQTSFLHSFVLSDFSMANWYMSKAPLGSSAP